MTDFRIEWTRATGGAIDRGFDSRFERDEYYAQLRDKYPDLRARLYEVAPPAIKSELSDAKAIVSTLAENWKQRHQRTTQQEQELEVMRSRGEL